MQTPNTKTQNRYSPAEQVVFVEYSSAEKGQHFMTVMGKENGRRKIVARIFREFDTVEKKMKYTAKDREGIEMFSDFNLYAMKKTFVDKAKELAKEMPAPEKSVQEKNIPKVETQIQPVKEKRTLKQKAQEFTQSLVEPTMKSENPEQEKVIEEMQREHDLKSIRGEKGKNKSQELSR